jgi:transcriptional regulator NrdR family protein
VAVALRKRPIETEHRRMVSGLAPARELGRDGGASATIGGLAAWSLARADPVAYVRCLGLRDFREAADFQEVLGGSPASEAAAPRAASAKSL